MIYRVQSFVGSPEEVAQAMELWLAAQPLMLRYEGGPVLIQISQHTTSAPSGLVMTALVLAAVARR